ncbi:hypothetical protein DERP_013634 [Dermatophagoides pteronyssinus]|uniref:Uncharacterized protein n=1 Tax=Dermatophagoides pteronyssinus TaxID=6956 RepID=A0ABQ8IQB9_DERPT|nr:hypothetical protein DERP_013634 [Dermatophagoides pteronyssinus]
MATSTDFYEIALQRKRQHGCILISILLMAIIITMLIIFNKDVLNYWHSIIDPYYYPPEWDHKMIMTTMMNDNNNDNDDDYTYDDYQQLRQEIIDYQINNN